MVNTITPSIENAGFAAVLDFGIRSVIVRFLESQGVGKIQLNLDGLSARIVPWCKSLVGL